MDARFQAACALLSCCCFAAQVEARAPEPTGSVDSSTPASDVGDSSRLEQLYDAGQSAFDQGEYESAAANWSNALALLQESSDTSSTRSMILLNALSAYMEAYRDKDDLRHLRSAELLVRSYIMSLGGRTAIEAVLKARAKLDDMLNRAATQTQPVGSTDGPPPNQDRGKDAKEGQSNPTGAQDPAPLKTQVVAPSRAGTPWVVSGAVTGVLGLAASALIVTGQVMRIEAQENRDDTMGKRSDRLTASGAVVTAVLVSAGVTMIIVGARQRRKARLAFTPGFERRRGSNMVSLALSGRF